MVFFTCNACGESVKKIQVEKHVSACRNCECLSCIDCGKDFWGDDYKNHVKCLSEDQKYGGKGYEGRAHKGDVKQQAWIQKINELIKKPNVSPKVKELLEQISAFDNVPRKKAKFQNWMKNSLKVYSESILEQVWSIFSEASSSSEPGSKGQEQQPPEQGAKPPAEVTAKLPPSHTNGPAEEQTQAKKNKREKKEERQKNRKKEKKELKLENHQGNSKSQKPKKHKKGPEMQQEAGREEALKANGSAGKKGKKKQGQGKHAAEEDQVVATKDESKPAPRKRKRKHSEVEVDSKKKKVTVPGDSEDGEQEDQEAPAKGKFNWKGTIKAVLRQAPENEVSVKKLRKKVGGGAPGHLQQENQQEPQLPVVKGQSQASEMMTSAFRS
ncbi:cell growth-regulating nucleolar protein isoform X2 [Octodon degus]|uniref:Cell growth-regulating nucleolar protein n=1 Tax=Octodon degus TaxID=10160 RepID=A0A6P6F745_OCTDE|nr:cell growth-regulating nucleolar protein isoform X2 [Octodon degus]